jgi:hypothetical protein
MKNIEFINIEAVKKTRKKYLVNCSRNFLIIKTITKIELLEILTGKK